LDDANSVTHLDCDIKLKSSSGPNYKLWCLPDSFAIFGTNNKDEHSRACFEFCSNRNHPKLLHFFNKFKVFLVYEECVDKQLICMSPQESGA